MKNQSVETLFYNMENLVDDYADLPEAREASNKFNKFLEENFSVRKSDGKLTRNGIEASDLAMEYAVQFEKQGFLNGFQYAVKLLITG